MGLSRPGRERRQAPETRVPGPPDAPGASRLSSRTKVPNRAQKAPREALQPFPKRATRARTKPGAPHCSKGARLPSTPGTGRYIPSAPSPAPHKALPTPCAPMRAQASREHEPLPSSLRRAVPPTARTSPPTAAMPSGAGTTGRSGGGYQDQEAGRMPKEPEARN